MPWPWDHAGRDNEQPASSVTLAGVQPTTHVCMVAIKEMLAGMIGCAPPCTPVSSCAMLRR